MVPRNPVVLLIIIVLVGAGLGSFAVIQIAGEPRAYDYQGQHAQSAPGDQELAPSGANVRNRRPPTDQSVCRHAKTEKEYELCQAWRAADGAKEAAGTALWQLIVSIGGLVGLIYTVHFTRKAADAAQKAALAAAESAESAQETLIVSERPWLSVDPALASGLEWHAGNDMRFVVDLELWNHGRSPAVDIRIFRKLCPLSIDAERELQTLIADALAGAVQPLLFKPIFPQFNERYPVTINVGTADVGAVVYRVPDLRIDPAVIGCVLYKAAFAEAVHHIGFIAELRLVTPGAPNVQHPFEVRADGTLVCGQVDADYLRLSSVYLRQPLS